MVVGFIAHDSKLPVLKLESWGCNRSQYGLDSLRCGLKWSWSGSSAISASLEFLREHYRKGIGGTFSRFRHLAPGLEHKLVNDANMDAQTIIAKRIAQELRSGMLVNLGIGIPTLVANYLPPDITVLFQSENGLIGTGPIPEDGMAHRLLTDAGGRPVSALPGASTFDSAMSFGLIRGGHVDMTVLGGLQVDEQGHLANWMIPGKMVPGMGGAMDLVSGAKRVVVAMQHTAKGKPKIVKKCSLPLTSARPVTLVVSELAVIDFLDGHARLLETAPGVTVQQVLAKTEAMLMLPDRVVTMAL